MAAVAMTDDMTNMTSIWIAFFIVRRSVNFQQGTQSERLSGNGQVPYNINYFFFLICIKHQVGSFSAIFMTRGNVNNINFVGNFDKHVSGNLDSHTSENIALQRAINDHF